MKWMEVSADCKAAEGRVSLRRKTRKIEGRKRDRVLRGQSGWGYWIKHDGAAGLDQKERWGVG